MGGVGDLGEGPPEGLDGVDGPELEREERQRAVQASRIGAWGSSSNGSAHTLDPAEGGAAKRDNLLTYEQLFALWEKRNWRSHELDFSIDREQWPIGHPVRHRV